MTTPIASPQVSRNKFVFTALAIASAVFTFSWLPVPRLYDGASICLSLFFVFLIFSPSEKNLRKDPAIQLGIAFFLFLAFSIVWHQITLPDAFPNTSSDRRFLRVFYFIPIAYAIHRSPLLSAWHLLALSYAGLSTYLIATFDYSEWVRALSGARVDFGIQNAQHTGLLFATLLLIAVFFTPRFIFWSKKKKTILTWIANTAWSAMLLFTLWGVAVSQTRAIWLGLTVALLALLPFAAAFTSAVKVKSIFTLRKISLAITISAILAGTLFSTNLPYYIGERISAENVNWDKLYLVATHQDREITSIKVRIASWSAAATWFAEKPFLGWGGRGSRPLIQQSDLFSDEFKERFDHLHNSYLQVLIEIGIIGAAFILALITLVARATIRAYRNGTIPLDVFLFSWTTFFFWTIANTFESYIIYDSGKYLFAIIGGTVYSFCIPDSRSRETT